MIYDHEDPQAALQAVALAEAMWAGDQVAWDALKPGGCEELAAVATELLRLLGVVADHVGALAGVRTESVFSLVRGVLIAEAAEAG